MNKELEGKLNKAKVLFKEGTDITIDDNGTYIGACLIAALTLVHFGVGTLFGELSEDEED